MTNPYETLGVSTSASQEDIKKAFKKLARQYHPDVNKAAGAEDRFKEVNAAYAAIGEPEKRKLYDQFGDVALQPGFDPERARQYGGFTAGAGAGGVDMEDLFGSLFGQDFAGGGPRAGGPRQRRTASTGAPGAGFEDFFTGFGGGFPGGAAGGRGADQRAELTVDPIKSLVGGEERFQIRRPNGQVEALTVKIPPGVKDGGRLRLRGQGLPPRGGGPCGDLLLTLKVPEHPIFKRSGELDLEMVVPLTVLESIEGTRITVPTPTGDVKVTVPSAVESGQRLRLKGKGVQRRSNPGDLYLVLQTQAPPADDPEVLEAARKLEEAYAGDVRASLRG